MSLGFYFSPDTLTAAQYDQAIAELKKAGAQHPPGREYHACFGSPDKLMVFDVWSSQEAFEAFGQTLIPILQAVGVNPGQPSVMPIHSVIVPPAKVTRPAKAPAKAKPAKKSAKKRPKKAAKKAARRGRRRR